MACGGCFVGFLGIAKPRKEGKITLGYWGIRGLGAPFRMLLTYVGADYEDKQYTTGTDWFQEDKPAIQAKSPLANLPYMTDGDVTVCQTNAIFEYLGDRFGIGGETMEERRRNREMLCEIYDLRNEIIMLVYPFKAVCRDKEEFMTKMTAHLTEGCKKSYDKIDKFIAAGGGPYTCGRKLVAADFHVWEMLDQHEVYAAAYGQPSPMKAYPRLQSFHAGIKSAPQLARYFASDASKLPCNAGIAYTAGAC
mmetsp:Transcript_42032/g.108893  ORF Transcript_42032/g.108893 Transcript_42032/m.108893 type:complete len:250 (+) Transcript_42032:53-802(+)